jgi:hypothetical protein
MLSEEIFFRKGRVKSAVKANVVGQNDVKNVAQTKLSELSML